MKKCVLRITILSLIFCIFLSMKCVVSNAAVQIWDSSAKKYRSYTIYNQSTISDTYIKKYFHRSLGSFITTNINIKLNNFTIKFLITVLSNSSIPWNSQLISNKLATN